MRFQYRTLAKAVRRRTTSSISPPPQPPLVLSRSFAHLSRRSPRRRNFGIAFDIDGVIFRSEWPIGGSPQALKRLYDEDSQTATGVVTATAAGIVDTSAAVNYEDLNNQQKNHVLSLDLNLPAPEDLDAHQHHRAEQSPSLSKFQFASKKWTKAMMFLAPALVGCHY
ncbi:unnamed protein product [Linum trigynum]|uniref:Uncharacterized protein n=1 Tax=Linum trigynum TaxID=586398 RepID=A0AAV2CX67_9ROSI